MPAWRAGVILSITGVILGFIFRLPTSLEQLLLQHNDSNTVFMSGVHRATGHYCTRLLTGDINLQKH